MHFSHLNTLIIGGGAVGSYLAARLLEKGTRVEMLAGASRQQQLSLRGLHVMSPFGRCRRPIAAKRASEFEASYHLVILACRSHRLDEAISAARAAVNDSTVVLSLVDGGPHLVEVARHLPSQRLYEGIFEGRLTLDADGAVAHRPPEARILLDAKTPGDRIRTNLISTLNGRGLEAGSVSDFPRRVWARSIYLAAGTGASVVTNQPLRDALRFYPGRAFFASMLRECRDIAAAAGVDVDRNDTRRYRHGLFMEGEPIAPPPRGHSSSGAGLEAAFLLSTMLARASALHVLAPALAGAAAALAEAPKAANRG